MSPKVRAAAWALLACGPFLAAQVPDAARMKADLFYLAGPECQGRATGQPGQRLAATYIARRMKENGLAPLAGKGMGGASPYYFAYRLRRARVDAEKTLLRSDAATLHAGQDFVALMRPAPARGEAVFIGYGISAPDLHWDELHGVDLKGKWAVALNGHPPALDASGQDDRLRLRAKRDAALARGALGFVEVQAWTASFLPVRDMMQSWASERLSLEGAATPRSRDSINLSEAAAKTMGFDAAEARKALDAAAGPLPPRGLGTWSFEPSVTEDSVEACDLAAVIPGRDPRLKDEYIVLSAHHDHLGVQGGVLHPGADDNASGTTGILEAGRLLAKAKPRRSILILSVSGEELGLFGSEAFLAKPPVDAARIKADINIDMVGREAPDDLTVTPAQIPGAVGTLTARARALAPGHGFSLRPDADAYWTRSDHYNFFKQGIPAIFFFDGMTADYHQAGDTPDKIELDKVAKVVALARDLALDAANAEEAPKALPEAEWKAWTWPTPQPSR
ncbi:MAG TPA: M28 family peptidase [Holophagaceae bacterium]|nr:M28 family peptidase [Holophagaceae bacterium]